MDNEKELADAHWLQTDDDLAPMLHSKGWLGGDESIQRVESAGEGNMNWTLRVVTQRRSFILKQSRPWVAKFPAIAAPVQRALYEIRFYETVAPIESVSCRMPKLLGSDACQYLLVMEDLGAASDGSFLYEGSGEWLKQNAADFFGEQIDWLGDLHRETMTEHPPSDFRNLDLRKLNHEHIFHIPLLDPPELDVDSFTPGLAEVAAWTRKQRSLVEACQSLGQSYLSPDASRPHCLLHGDYYPCSWLFLADGVRIIDPEFCYYGPPEFDLGVLAAHAIFAGFDPSAVEPICDRYRQRAGVPARRELVGQWAGIEIIRRLLGYAQLPLDCGLEQKRQWIEWAVELVT